jgi:hypothetical protein
VRWFARFPQSDEAALRRFATSSKAELDRRRCAPVSRFRWLACRISTLLRLVADVLLGHTRRFVHVRLRESTRGFRDTPCQPCPGRGVTSSASRQALLCFSVGSSGLLSSGRLPWFYASALVLLALCVLCGVLFMVLLEYHSEVFLHGNAYTRFQYIRNQALGFSALACFCAGCSWLVVAIVIEMTKGN